jgi:transposase InsO family protein
VHHSDRGVQYASHDYTQLLQNHGIQISMSRQGNPWDNAACESFIKTLKYEEVYRTEYRDLADARIAAQIPAEEKSLRADYRIDCSTTLEATRRQVESLYPELQRLAAGPA